MKIILVIILIGLPQLVFAWGGRGHDSICQAAVFLVKNKDLADFLKMKINVMSILCNVPDVDWRNLDSSITKIGNPTHHVDHELLGVTVDKVPTDLNEIIEKYTSSETSKVENKMVSVPKELGTNWWRADQMFRRSVDYAKKISTAAIPTNSKQEQDNDLDYNKAVYEMMLSMGILGHFVGDNSMPFHNTTDYDGWAANQGGIHLYYETLSVSQLGPDLTSKVVQRAQKLKNTKYMSGKTPVEKMRSLASVSIVEIKDILKADPIIKNSQLKIEKGMSLKTPAERQPPEVGAKRFEKLIVDQMARSASLLAAFWDEAYAQAGNPNLKPYRSYRHPYTVDFIMPDYYKVESDSKK